MADVQDGNGSPAAADWSDEHRFAVVAAVPVVRDAVRVRAERAKLPMSAEEFLAKSAMVVPGLGRAMDRGAVARGRRLGFRCGVGVDKSTDRELADPIGRVIADVLCSLAAHGQVVVSVEQHDNGCTLKADIPSDHKTFGGDLRVSIERNGSGGTSVHAEAEIPGQLIDWGKSKQTLADLMAEIGAPPAKG